MSKKSKKPSTPGSGSNRPSKKSSPQVPATETGSDIMKVSVAHHTEEQLRLYVQSEDSSNEQSIESLANEDVTTDIENEVVNINNGIAKNEQRMKEAGRLIKNAQKFLLALIRSEPLEQLFNGMCTDSISFGIHENQSSEDQVKCLSTFVKEKEAEIAYLFMTILSFMTKGELQSRKCSRMMFSEPLGDALRSGVHYIEEIFRIEYVSDNESHDIGLLEKDPSKQSEFRIKENIETWEPCPELVEALPLISESNLDTSDRTFMDKFLPKVPKLNPDVMENAWKSLTKTMTLRRNTAAEMKMQQYICTPFIELFIAAAGDVESDEYIADELISSSLTISCKLHEEEPYQEKRLSIKPDAAVTLRQEWDAFGMVEMKRGNHGNEKLYFRNIDKCTLMTAITAILVGRSINDDARHKIAIPFVIVEGHACYLYVATWDKRGVPRIKLVKFPEAGKIDANSEHIY